MAARHWVGGSGTWDAVNTANWSATSGGAGGASVPVAADTVFFSANSGAGTVTLAYSPTITIFSISAYTGTIDFQNNKVSCNNASSTTFFMDTSVTMLGNPLVEFTNNSASGRTFSATSVTEANAVSLNVTAGTSAVSVVGSVKNLNFTGFSGQWSVNACTIFGNLTIPNTMTVNASTNSITFGATSGTQQVTTNGVTIDRPLTQNSPGATVQLQDNLTMGSTRTFTLTAGTLDLTGNSGNWTLSTGLFSSNNSNTRSILFGTGNITVTGNAASIWNTGTATNFSYTGTPTVNATYAGSTGTRTIGTARTTTGGTEANSITFNVTAGTDIVTFGSTSYTVKTLNFTGFSGSFTPNGCFLFGNLVISSGMSLTASTSGIGFIGSTPQLVTTAGKTFDFPLTFGTATFSSNATFQDALTQGSTRAFTVTNGAVQLKNGVTSTVGAFATSGTNQKFLQSTLAGSTATLSQASGTVNASYLTIRDITAIGGATFNAYTDQSNVDAGNVEGWDFGISPIVGGAEYTYALRSLTEQRRF
jgi:hypothetical protein